MSSSSKIIFKFFIETVASGMELFVWQPEIFCNAEVENGDEATDLDYTHRKKAQEDAVTKK